MHSLPATARQPSRSDMKRPTMNRLTFDYMTAIPHQTPKSGGEFERSSPDPYHGYPLRLRHGGRRKGCCLLLTKQEYMTGLRRGKRWRRNVAQHTRQRGGGDA